MKAVKIEKAFFVKEKTLFPILPMVRNLPKNFAFNRTTKKKPSILVGRKKKSKS